MASQFHGDASIPLENKERIEILKGISALQSGFTTPGRHDQLCD